MNKKAGKPVNSDVIFCTKRGRANYGRYVVNKLCLTNEKKWGKKNNIESPQTNLAY